MPWPIRKRAGWRLAASLATLFALACAGSTPPTAGPAEPRPREPYLVDPLAGYPLTAEPGALTRLEDAFELLLAGGDRSVVRAAADELLARDPGFHPATVLRAQLALLDDRPRDAAGDVGPVVDELPGYLAARLVLGWAALGSDDVLAAFEAFDAVAARSGEAAEQAERLRPRALDILHNRLEQALAQGRPEDGAAALERLRAWAPEDLRTAEAAWQVAAARRDPAAERLALEVLLASQPDRRDALERLAALLIESGDLQAGIVRYEALAARYPDDPALAEQVERARFRWRLETLPAAVRGLADAPELSRADFAALLYWLVPEVRYAALENPPIATDILDHPRRDEILRVANLDLLEIDETVHRFAPARPVARAEVLAAFLTLLTRSGSSQACLADGRALGFHRSESLVCEVAARCALLAEVADCLPSAPVAGADALELFRRTLDLLE